MSHVVELLDINPEELSEEDGANVDLYSQRKGKTTVIKTSTRQTFFLPLIGLVEAEELRPGDWSESTRTRTSSWGPCRQCTTPASAPWR